MPETCIQCLLEFLVVSRSNGGVVCWQENSASKSREQQRANSQPTPTHAGGDRKLSAAAAFGVPIPNFGGDGATGAAQGSITCTAVARNPCVSWAFSLKELNYMTISAFAISFSNNITFLRICPMP